MLIIVSIPSEETIPTEDEVKEAESSPYFEHCAETAEREISSETILNVN
jgi:hypothetical protein